MPTVNYEELVESVQDIMPKLTIVQAEKLNQYIEDNDLASAYWLLKYLSNFYRRNDHGRDS